MPVISLDYCFVDAETETDMVTVLVMVQKPEGCVAAIMVIHKGPIEYVNSAVEFYIDVWGSAHIILKGDQEASLQAVISAVKNRTAWGRLGRAKFKSELGKIGETIDYKIQAKDYSKLEPRTMKLRAKGDRCNREVYNTFIGVPWGPTGLEVKGQNEVHDMGADVTGGAIVAGGDVAPTTPRLEEPMEMGIIMPISRGDGQRVCEEIEPRVNCEKLVGDGVYRDACAGEELLTELVVNGRAKEMKSMEEFEGFEWVPFEDWMKPFDTKWIDSKKYDLQTGEWIVRSRCVHRGYSDGTDPMNFAGAPALWAVKLVISRAASLRSTDARKKKLGLYDVSVAFFHASLKGPQCCWPPLEQRLPGMLWKLTKAMSGTPEASMLFQGEVRGNFKHHGCEELMTVCCLYYHPEKDSLCAGRGCDFVVEAYDEELDEFDELMASRFKVRPQPRVGPGGAVEGTFPNRTQLWAEEGSGIFADPKLSLKMVELHDLKQAKLA
ncbi:unnamed protein product, partial [Prorocentrum cordatum]